MSIDQHVDRVAMIWWQLADQISKRARPVDERAIRYATKQFPGDITPVRIVYLVAKARPNTIE